MCYQIMTSAPQEKVTVLVTLTVSTHPVLPCASVTVDFRATKQCVKVSN